MVLIELKGRREKQDPIVDSQGVNVGICNNEGRACFPPVSVRGFSWATMLTLSGMMMYRVSYLAVAGWTGGNSAIVLGGYSLPTVPQVRIPVFAAAPLPLAYSFRVLIARFTLGNNSRSLKSPAAIQSTSVYPYWLQNDWLLQMLYAQRCRSWRKCG